MKLIMENWRKFEEKEKNRLDEAFRGPTDDPRFSDPGYNEPEGYDVFADKVSDIVDDVTRGQEFKMPNGQVLSYEDFGDGDGQYILDGDVFANSFDEAEEKLLDMMDMDSVMSSLNESQITRLISEEIDRLIEEGLLEEGFKDKLMKFLLGTMMFTGALGGMPGKAQAEMTPDQATAAVVKAVGAKLDGKYRKNDIDVASNMDVHGLDDAMARMSKTRKDNSVVKAVAKALEAAEKDGTTGATIIQLAKTLNDIADKDKAEAAEAAKKAKKAEKMKKKKATKADMVNFDGAVANAYNGLRLASAQGDDAKLDKAVDNLFDILDAAEKQGGLDGKAGQAKKLLGKGDMQGFKKLMGY